MDTIMAIVNNSAPDKQSIEKAAAILQQDGLVAFPTETVYGLGANGLSEAACKKIFEAKGRPTDNPLILHIGEIEQIWRIIRVLPDKAKAVMDAFWPGPLTLILPKARCIPSIVTGGFDTVAVRFPSNAVARLLINAAGVPIAAPSANSSGKPSPTRASHVMFDLGGKIDIILDGGACDVGLESTILDITGEIPMILRPGAVTKEMLEEIVGTVALDPAVFGQEIGAGVAPRAPGMKYTHYSPTADVVLVKGTLANVVEKINSLTEQSLKKGARVGIMATQQTKAFYPKGEVLVLGDRANIADIAANLFKYLRKFDYIGVDIVYAEVFEEIGEGVAVMNRLKKAAGHHIIEVE